MRVLMPKKKERKEKKRKVKKKVRAGKKNTCVHKWLGRVCVCGCGCEDVMRPDSVERKTGLPPGWVNAPGVVAK